MTALQVDCPECGDPREVTPDEYEVFELSCSSCGATAKGEYRSGTDPVFWRWYERPNTGDAS